MERKDFITQSLELGKTPDQISEKLAFNGYDPLSANEQRDIAKGVYGKNLAQKTWKDVRDLGSGLATFLGGAGKYITDNEFNQYVNRQAEKLTPSIIGEMLTENWNYNPAMFMVDPKKGIRDVIAGVQAQPGLATLDLLPVIGEVGKAAKGLPRLAKSGNVSATAKSITGEVISSDKAINDILNISREAPGEQMTKLRDLYGEIKDKYTPDEIAKAYQNLEEGTRVGGEIILNATEDVNKFAREVDALMKKVGVNPNKAEEVAVFQNMSRMLKNDAGLDINIDDLVKASEGNTKSVNKLQKFGVDGDIYSDYFNRASELYNQGLIFPVRHASNKVYQRGKSLITLDDLKKGALAERKYGTQSYEDLGKSFVEGGYEPLLKELERANQTTGALSQMVGEIGVKVDPTNLPKLAKGEVFVSPQVLQETIGATIEQGGKLKDAIRHTLNAFSDSIEGLPTDNIYIMRKKDLNALENAFATDKKLPGMLSNLASIGKQSALATTNYIFGNALANITSNMATGTNLNHYLQAIDRMNELPSALKRTSSYQGYLGRDLDANSKLKQVYKQLFKDIASGDKSAMEKFKLSHTVANYPIFRAASQVEIMDRGASFFKNAERLAKELKKDVDEVIKEAQVNGGNNPTFKEIKRRIDNDLGDYVGHNYYLDPRWEEALRAVVPFYRPYTQGGRVLLNIAKNYPAYYQTQVKLPSYIGNRLTEESERRGVTPSEEYGGVGMRARFGRVPSQVMYNPYHNVTAIGEIAGGLFGGSPELLPAVNTFAITPFLSLMGLNRYGTQAKLPNSYTVNGKQMIVDNNGNVIQGEPTISDRIKLILAQSFQTYAPGVNTVNKSVLPILSAIIKEDYRTPSDYSIFGQVGDNKLPLLSEGSKTARVTAVEKVLPTIGFKITTTYPKDKNKPSLRDIKKVRQQQYINRLINERGQ